MLGGGDEGRRVGDGGGAWQHGPDTVMEAQRQRVTCGHTSTCRGTPLPLSPFASLSPLFSLSLGSLALLGLLLRLCPVHASASPEPPHVHFTSDTLPPARGPQGSLNTSSGSHAPSAVDLQWFPIAFRAVTRHGFWVHLTQPLVSSFCHGSLSQLQASLFSASGPLHTLLPLPGKPVPAILPGPLAHSSFEVSSA